MRKINLCLLLTILFLCECAYLLGTQAFSLAAAEPTAAPPEATPVTIEIIYTPEPTTRLTPPPSPTPCPELPDYQVSSKDVRALASALWSVCPARPTDSTKIAFCELVQNRIGVFEDTIPKVLAQPHEFLDYDAHAYRSRENTAIAEYALRSHLFAELTGDRCYRLVPQDGLFCDFYRLDGWDYIKIYNRAGDVVYDSGARKGE